MKKKLPVGIDSFEKIRSQDFYYVDKTSLIRDLLLKWGEVNLFTRPRRFGKSLNMSMLKAFFEIGCDKTLFEGLEISKESHLCEEYMGQFPVISISLKDVSGSDFASARALFSSVIGNEAMRFQFFLDDCKLSEQEKEQYRQLIHVDASGKQSFSLSDSVLMGSLKTLSVLLEKHYNRKVIILIDEYDVPLAKASENGYYDEMVLLLRNIFQQALKSNGSLHFAVMTGCLRVAKESIFTGLNNPKILSLTSVRFDEYFGFTDREVRDMLAYYGLEEKYESVKSWYDGYRFGNVDVYCPWDVINYCDELTDDIDTEPKDYWSNTSGNDVVRHFIENTDMGPAESEIEELIAGDAVTKVIREELTYNRLYDSAENLWSVLLMTGYLTYRGKPEGKKYRLAIPNMEIRNIFTEQIMSMFLKKVAGDGEHFNAFCEALKNGEAAEAENLFMDYLNQTISIRDTFARKPTKENFYHGILLGILGYKKEWSVKSNQEAGEGYSDISIIIPREGIGILIEVKYGEKDKLDAACQAALRQIHERGYEKELLNHDCGRILKYGIACYKKQCRIMLEEPSTPWAYGKRTR